MEILRKAAFVYYASDGLLLGISTFAGICAWKITKQRKGSRKWQAFYVRVFVAMCIVGVGFLIEPIIWGLFNKWESDLWIQFSHQKLSAWILLAVKGGIVPGLLIGAAASTASSSNEKRIIAIRSSAASVFALVLHDSLQYASGKILWGEGLYEGSAIRQLSFSLASNIVGGTIGGFLAFWAAEALLNVRIAAWRALQDYVERTPLMMRIALAIIAMAFLGPTLVTRSLPLFGLELAPSFSFVKLAREAYLSFEVVSSDSIVNWGFEKQAIIISDTEADPDKINSPKGSRRIKIRIKYPESRRLRLFSLQIRHISQAAGNTYFVSDLSCKDLPAIPLDLEDSLIEFSCDLPAQFSAASHPLSNQELHAMMSRLPSWGKGWMISRNSELQIRYTTASRQNYAVKIPINIFSPSVLIENKLRTERISRRELDVKFKKAAKALNSKAGLLAKLGAPIGVNEKVDFDPRGVEQLVYACAANRPLCRRRFTLDSKGNVLSSYWTDPDYESLIAAIVTMTGEFKALKNQGDAIHKFGEPLHKIGNSWYYPLSNSPENAIFRLVFDSKESLISVDSKIRLFDLDGFNPL